MGQCCSVEEDYGSQNDLINSEVPIQSSNPIVTQPSHHTINNERVWESRPPIRRTPTNLSEREESIPPIPSIIQNEREFGREDSIPSISRTVHNKRVRKYPPYTSRRNKVQGVDVNRFSRADAQTSISTLLELIDREKNRLKSTKQISRDDDMAKKAILAILSSETFRNKALPPEGGPYTLEELDQKSIKFVDNVILRNQRFRQEYDVFRVLRVWNPYLMLQYTLNKIKYKGKLVERHLYHGTGLNSLHSILTNNFNWRLVREYTHGKGVYFSNNPYFAKVFSEKRRYGPCLVMIVAKVLIEKDVESICLGDEFTEIPPVGHTTKGGNKQEFVKFDDACFYPEFVIHFLPHQ